MPKKLVKSIIPGILLLISGMIAYQLMKTGPEVKRHSVKPTVPVVEVMQVKKGDYPVKILSHGIITARTQSTLVAEVSGRIVHVASDFRSGGFFPSDQILVQIDPAEYYLEIANIKAALSGVNARITELGINASNLKKSLAIESEQLSLANKQFQRYQKLRQQDTIAQSTLEKSEQEYLQHRVSLQALKNKLDLIPIQLKVLEAEQKLKLVQLDRTKLNLERTKIRAPYSGRVLEKKVDVGQSVSKGSVLASIYAVDFIEVQLPITDLQATFLEFPKSNSEQSSHAGTPQVLIRTVTVGSQQQWQGRIVRTAGSIDTRTQQQLMIAQIDIPDAQLSGGYPRLKVGQFVVAEILGRTLRDVFILPRNTVRAGNEVLLITSDSKLERRQIKVLWQDQENIITQSGFTPGERILLTALPYVPNGAPIKVNGEKTSIKASYHNQYGIK